MDSVLDLIGIRKIGLNHKFGLKLALSISMTRPTASKGSLELLTFRQQVKAPGNDVILYVHTWKYSYKVSVVPGINYMC